MIKYTRTLFSLAILSIVAMPVFSQKADPAPQTEEKREASKTNGLRRVAGPTPLNIDIDIDENALEASIESAIENAMRAVETTLEKLEIHIEPIEINLGNLDVNLDPIVINIP